MHPIKLKERESTLKIGVDLLRGSQVLLVGGKEREDENNISWLCMDTKSTGKTAKTNTYTNTCWISETHPSTVWYITAI